MTETNLACVPTVNTGLRGIIRQPLTNKEIMFDDDYDDDCGESRPRRQHHRGCSDGFCGATDCQTCHGSNAGREDESEDEE